MEFDNVFWCRLNEGVYFGGGCGINWRQGYGYLLVSGCQGVRVSGAVHTAARPIYSWTSSRIRNTKITLRNANYNGDKLDAITNYGWILRVDKLRVWTRVRFENFWASPFSWMMTMSEVYLRVDFKKPFRWRSISTLVNGGTIRNVSIDSWLKFGFGKWAIIQLNISLIPSTNLLSLHHQSLERETNQWNISLPASSVERFIWGCSVEIGSDDASSCRAVPYFLSTI